MASVTDICNMALAHLGTNLNFIMNFETERTKEARACRQFYATARDTVLRDFPWPFATRVTNLNLAEENPTVEWRYSYRYPINCLNFRRILPGLASDRRQTWTNNIPYRIVGDDSGRLIWTDEASPAAEWTTQITETGQFTPDFCLALSFLLASLIAPMVTVGDQFKLGARAFEFYQLQVSATRATAANEDGQEEQPDDDFVRIRN